MDSSKNSKIGKINGKNIKRLRKEQELSQAAVAKKAGIKTNYFAVIERGEVTTNSGYLLKISQALGVEISELYKS